MNGVRRQHRDTGVLVLEVVPIEEGLTVSCGSTDVGEPSWEPRSIFERFELRLGERIIITGMRPRVRLDHAEIHQQLSDQLRLHR